MFSTRNYRPNNVYYTHKGQILKRTARGYPLPYKYSMSDIAGLNQWISMNNYNNDNYPPNPGDNEITDIDLSQITNIKLNTINNDDQSYTVTPSQQSNNFVTNSMDFYNISSSSATTLNTLDKFTAASITLVQKPDNKVYIGYELLSLQYQDSSPSTASIHSVQYQLPQLTYTTSTVSDIYYKFYFNVQSYSNGYASLSPNNFYIKAVTGLSFDYNDQSLIIPINATVNEDLITSSSSGNQLYYFRKVGTTTLTMLKYNGDLVFSDLSLATINLNES